jgi:hypothetical protein
VEWRYVYVLYKVSRRADSEAVMITRSMTMKMMKKMMMRMMMKMMMEMMATIMIMMTVDGSPDASKRSPYWSIDPGATSEKLRRYRWPQDE